MPHTAAYEVAATLRCDVELTSEQLAAVADELERGGVVADPLLMLDLQRRLLEISGATCGEDGRDAATALLAAVDAAMTATGIVLEA